MRSWLKLYSYIRDRPVNGVTVFTTLRDEKERTSFLKKSSSTPYVEKILSEPREGLINSIIVRFLADEVEDCAYLEYMLSFAMNSLNTVNMAIEIDAEGMDILKRRYNWKLSCRSSRGPATLACETLESLSSMITKEVKLTEMYEMLTDAYCNDPVVYYFDSCI